MQKRDTAVREKQMNIAIVGGGERGLRLMEIIERHNFQEVKQEIIAVDDTNLRAPAVIKAMEQGLFVTDNYRDFLKVGNVELIVELTGNDDPYREVKERFNRYALERAGEFRLKIDRSPDPLNTAVRLAIAGNIIDFGPKSELDDHDILWVDAGIIENVRPK